MCVEDTVAKVAKSGTKATTQAIVYDSYEVLEGHDTLRAYIDLDIKRWSDRNPIARLEGVVLVEHIKTALETIVPILEERYGRILVGNSSGTKSKTEYCVSFRIWFPCIVGSRYAIQLLCSSIYSEIQHVFQSAVGDFRDRIDWSSFFDNSVYKNMGKLRLPGCTKQGETYRPLLLDPQLSSSGWSYTDALVTWWNPGEVQTLPTPEHVTPIQQTHTARLHDNEMEIQIDINAKLTDTQFQLVTELASLFSTQWDKNAQRFQLIAALWSMEPSVRMKSFIHAQAAAKNPNNRPAAIDTQISRIQYAGVSAKTILKHAWDSYKTETQSIKTKYREEWNQLFGTPSDTQTVVEKETVLINEIVSQEKKDIWTLEVYSERYVREYPFRKWDTIVIQSHMGTGKTVQLFDAIKTFRRVLILSARRSYSSFINSELFTMELGFTNYMDVKGHLSGHNRLILQVESLHRIAWEYEPYDLVIMDESESLLFQMNSAGTHKEHHKENYELLERIVREGTKVIGMDAFITDRSLFFFDSMRVRSKCIFIQNVFQPYDRIAQELCILKGKQILPDFPSLVKQCFEFAKEGKRIVFVCTSKMKGDDLYQKLLKEGYKVLFHSSDDSKEEKDILLNIREEWAKYQIVIYTTTITVGVSYSNVPKSAEFDELFLYATASCALPRDIAQALLRARVITSNRLWFCIEERCVKPSSVGLKAIEEDIARRKDLFAHSQAKWLSTPEWVTQLIAHNENEIAVSRSHFPLVLKRYLRMSGYTIVMPKSAENMLELEMETEVKPTFDEIATLDDIEADAIEEKIMQGEASKQDKIALTKYRMMKRFVEGSEAVARETWNTLFVPEEGKTRTREALFWNIANEKQRNVQTALAAEASNTYIEHAKKSILKQSGIQDLCKMLGIPNTCCEKTWTQEEFTKLAPAILKEEERLRKSMGLRARQGKKKESDFHQATELVKQAFESWSGSVVDKVIVKNKRENNVMKRLYTVTVTPAVQKVWNCLK
jgi:hypothetical protein